MNRRGGSADDNDQPKELETTGHDRFCQIRHSRYEIRDQPLHFCVLVFCCCIFFFTGSSLDFISFCFDLLAKLKLACLVYVFFLCLVRIIVQIIVSQEAQKECATCPIGGRIRSTNTNGCTQTKHFQVSTPVVRWAPRFICYCFPFCFVFVWFLVAFAVFYSLIDTIRLFTSFQRSFGQLRTR